MNEAALGDSARNEEARVGNRSKRSSAGVVEAIVDRLRLLSFGLKTKDE